MKAREMLSVASLLIIMIAVFSVVAFSAPAGTFSSKNNRGVQNMASPSVITANSLASGTNTLQIQKPGLVDTGRVTLSAITLPSGFGDYHFVDATACGRYQGSAYYLAVSSNGTLSQVSLDYGGKGIITDLNLSNQGNTNIVKIDCTSLVYENGLSTLFATVILDDARVYMLDRLRGTFNYWCDLDTPTDCKIDRFSAVDIGNATTAYIAARDTLYKYTLGTGSVTRIIDATQFSAEPLQFYDAYYYSDTLLLLGTSRGVAYINPLDVSQRGFLQGLSGDDVQANAITLQGTLLIATVMDALGTHQSLITYDLGTNTLGGSVEWPTTNGVVLDIEQVYNDYYTAGTFGIVKYKTSTGQFIATAVPGLTVTSLAYIGSSFDTDSFVVGTNRGLYLIVIERDTGLVTKSFSWDVWVAGQNTPELSVGSESIADVDANQGTLLVCTLSICRDYNISSLQSELDNP
ncbi:hypothetical protein HZB01_04480 [Candidatus Woesearchaeota archaeon]|nr:hypothetical protein [Candidatus Woesearchaeota archaeon]